MWLVIQVIVDDYWLEPKNAKFIEKFNSDLDARKFIRDKTTEQLEGWQKRYDYIDKWVDDLDTSSIDHNKEPWSEIIKQCIFFEIQDTLLELKLQENLNKRFNVNIESDSSNYVYFKSELKDYFKREHELKFDGYDPPHADFKWDGLLVVEIPEEIK